MAHQFEPDVIEGICGYMNDGSMRQNLTEIVQALTGDDTITEAKMTGFDGDGFDVDTVADGGKGTARLNWTRPISERAEVREQLLLLFERAAFG
jgi:hypothetical protein